MTARRRASVNPAADGLICVSVETARDGRRGTFISFKTTTRTKSQMTTRGRQIGVDERIAMNLSGFRDNFLIGRGHYSRLYYSGSVFIE